MDIGEKRDIEEEGIEEHARKKEHRETWRRT
jgi:hypothetical protein